MFVAVTVSCISVIGHANASSQPVCIYNDGTTYRRFERMQCQLWQLRQNNANTSHRLGFSALSIALSRSRLTTLGCLGRSGDRRRGKTSISRCYKRAHRRMTVRRGNATVKATDTNPVRGKRLTRAPQGSQLQNPISALDESKN